MAINKRITTSLEYFKGSVRLSINALATLGNPEYLAILFNENSNQMAFLPSGKEDRAAFKIKYIRGSTFRGMVIYTCKFVRKVFAIEKWDVYSRYQIKGYYLEDANVIYFDLSKAYKASKVDCYNLEEID